MKAEDRMRQLQHIADDLVEQGAPGTAFEALHRRGWKPKSYLEGKHLEACPSDCGVCFPPPVLRRKK